MHTAAFHSDCPSGPLGINFDMIFVSVPDRPTAPMVPPTYNASMDERAGILAHMAFCEAAIVTISRRQIKGLAWRSEHHGWLAYLDADRTRLAELDEC